MLERNFIENKIREKGYIPLEFEITDWKNTKIIFSDGDGYKYSIGWENFKCSKNFKAITYTNPFSLENAKLYLKNHDINIEIISQEIKDVTSNLEFGCSCEDCNNTFICSWNRLKRRKYYLCDKCLESKKGIITNKFSKEFIQKEFNEFGLFLNENFCYEGNNKGIECHDSKGYMYFTSHILIKEKLFPRKFAKNNPFMLHNIKVFLKENKLETKLLTNDYIDRKHKMKWECGKCHEIFYKSWQTFYSKASYYCSDCCQKYSKNENSVIKYLTTNEINFICQKRFEDCCDKKSLPFDFYLSDFNVCIEVDGEQHYKAISKFGGEKEFIKTQKHDKIKNDYCKRNHIKLLRLPFFVFQDKKEYKNLIDKIIK